MASVRLMESEPSYEGDQGRGEYFAESLIPYFDKAFERSIGREELVETNGVITRERIPTLRGRTLHGLVLATHVGNIRCERSILETVKGEDGKYISYNFVRAEQGVQLKVHEFSRRGEAKPDRDPTKSESTLINELLRALGSEEP